jgi:hypothetical protein
VKGNFHARFLGGCGRANRPHLPGDSLGMASGWLWDGFVGAGEGRRLCNVLWQCQLRTSRTRFPGMGLCRTATAASLEVANYQVLPRFLVSTGRLAICRLWSGWGVAGDWLGPPRNTWELLGGPSQSPASPQPAGREQHREGALPNGRQALGGLSLGPCQSVLGRWQGSSPLWGERGLVVALQAIQRALPPCRLLWG